MAADQDVGGIALGLTLDTTGWSSGVARAKAELEGLKRSAQQIEIGVTTRGRGGGVGGPSAIAGGPTAVSSGLPATAGSQPTVSPRFQVSAASVRQLRVDINSQLRALSAGGEAVSVPVKLGRVNYGAMRSEIAAGIGEVPIRLKPDAASLTAFAAVLSAMTGQTPGRARQSIEQAAAARGIPARAQGGPASAGRPHLVGENGPEIHWPSSSGTYIAPRRAIGGGVQRVNPDAYLKWALERDRRMGGAGRIKVDAAEASMAGRGITMLRAMRREGEVDPQRLKMHREFYDIERRNIEAEARRIGVTGQQLTHVTAAVSSNQPWDRNVAEAIAAIRAVKTGQRGSFANAEQLATTAAILAGKQVTGVKRLPFAEAFYDPNAFPIDRWMGRITTLGMRHGTNPSGSRMELMKALRGQDWTGKDVPSPAVRRASVYGIEHMAREWGIDPREAQAEPWGVVRDLAKEAVGHFRLDKKTGLAVPRRRGGPVDPDQQRRLAHMFNANQDPGEDLRYQMERYRLASVKGDVVGMHFLNKAIQSHAGPLPGTLNYSSSNEGIERQLAAMEREASPMPGTRRWSELEDARRVGVSWSGRLTDERKPGVGKHGMSVGDTTIGGWDEFQRGMGLGEFGRNARGGYVRRARGGNAFASLDLDAFEYPTDRDSIRKRLLGHAEKFPHAAHNLHVTAISDAEMVWNAKDKRAFNTAGLYEDPNTNPGLNRRNVWLNADMSSEWRRANAGFGYSFARSPADVATHEFGHAIDYSLFPHGPVSGARARGGIGGDWAHDVEQMQHAMSSYGWTRDNEKFAESFLYDFQHPGKHMDKLFGYASALDRSLMANKLRQERRFRRKGGLAQAYRDTIAHGGGTFSQTGAPPTGRYAVGTAIGTASLVPADDPRAFMRGFKDLTEANSPYIGTWLNEGSIHIDPAMVRRHKGDAMRIAKQNEQLAIFDLKRMKEIPVRAFGGQVGGASSSLSASTPLLRRLKVSGEAPLQLSSSGQMVDVAGFGRTRGQQVAEAAEKWGMSPYSHSVDPITKRLPKGVKVRFSTEFSDYPDPSKFIRSGGAGMHGPDWHDRWNDPGQLTMGYFQPEIRGMASLIEALGRDRPAQPYFDPRGESVAPPKRWSSLSEWMKKGKWGQDSTGIGAGHRGMLAAYALDSKNRVLAHALLEATKDIPHFGPDAGKSIDAMSAKYVWTAPDQRGKGLASAMYARAEKLTGMPIAPSTSQTPFGRQLWSKPASERSFGRAFGTRQVSSDDVAQIRMRTRNPTGIDEMGWRVGAEALGVEPFRDFSNAVDPLSRPPRPKRARGQMKLPGFARGGMAERLLAQATPPGELSPNSLYRVNPQLLLPHTITPGLLDWENPKYLAKLRSSMLLEGIKEPVTIKRGSYGDKYGDFLTDGNHRVHLAASMPKLFPWVPAQFMSKQGYPVMPEEMGFERHWSEEDEYMHRMLASLKRQGRGRALGGGLADTARYIIGEIGRELFIPKRMEGIIPPDVAAQIPGAQGLLADLLSGRARRGGGTVKEIGGRGSEQWNAPEDGWVIPNRLMHRIPRHAGGEVHEHADRRFTGGKRYEDAFGNRMDPGAALFQMNAQRGGSAGNINTPGGLRSHSRPAAPPPHIVAANRTIAQLDPLAQSLTGAEPRAPLDVEAAREAARARAYAASARGLTGRAALGGLFGFLGGGRQRREAGIEAQLAERQLQNLLPKGVTGVDPGEFFTERMVAAQGGLKAARVELENLSKAGTVSGDQVEYLTQQVKAFGKVSDESEETLKRVGQLEETRTKNLLKAQGGAGANLLSVTAAGVAFNAGMQAVQIGIAGATEVLNPMIDQLTGFSATGQRVSKELADNLPQAGTLSTLLAQRGVGAGLGAGQLPFFQQQLGGGIYAKAGGNAANQAGDLFRAALSGAPSGLIGGYGGILGGGLGAGLLGGGTGLLESLAGTYSATRGAPTSAGIGGNFEAGVGALGRLSTEIGKTILMGTQGAPNFSNVTNPTVLITPKMQRATEEFFEYVNDATERGRSSQGLGAGARLGAARAGEAEAILAIPGLDDYTRQLAENGAVFRDSTGALITTQEGINKAAADVARGLTLPDRATFAATQAQGLIGQRGAAGVRGELERSTLIPGQLGQQLAANPFMRATSGIAKGFEPTLVNLREIQSLQDDITAEAKAGVEAQARLVDLNVGAGAGTQFRTYMADVSAYGAQIAGLNEQLANKQAALGVLQYNYQLRVLNRTLRDARGLAGQAGGSQVGQLQRQQWELGRESQRLALEAQRLQNEMSQRQINFQVAVAGFQAPGITGQERAARMEEARVEADFAQRQLNIQKQQTTIGGQQFGIEGQVFGLQTAIAVEELENQRTLLVQGRALEQEQLAVQKQIAALGARQAQVQAKAQSLFAEATGNFDAQLGAASQYVAQFGGTMAAAITAVRRAIAARPGGTGGGGTENNPGKAKDDIRGATGLLGFTGGETGLVVGEAGSEAVAILKNPRRGTLMGPTGGGGGNVVQVNINGPVVRDDSDIDTIVRMVADAVEDGLSRKASLMSTGSI